MLLVSIIPQALAVGDYDEYEDYDFLLSSKAVCNNKEDFSKGIFEIKCDPTWRTGKLCECVRTKAEQNILIKANLNNHLVTEEKVEKQQIQYTEKFVDVFSQMTIEADVQEKILFPKGSAKEEIGNCPPALFADRVKTNVESHYKEQNSLLIEMREKRVNQYQRDCVKNDSKRSVFGHVSSLVSAGVNAIVGASKQEVIDKKNGECEKLNGAIKLINDNIADGEVKGESCTDSANKLINVAYKKRLEIAIRHFTITNQFDKKRSTEILLESLLTYKAPKQSCPNPDYTPAGKATAFLVEFDKEYKKAGGEVNRPEACKPDTILEHRGKNNPGDSKILDYSEVELCNAMENMNTALADEVRLKYENKPKVDCINFAEYKTFKGMPTPALLNEFSKDSFLGGFGELLDTPKERNTDLEKDRYNFLRSNPLIAKLAQNPKSKTALGHMLKTLGKTLSGKTNDVDRLNEYLKFMKDDKKGLKSLLDNPKSETTNMFICEQMTKSFTAIQVSNDLPPAPKLKADGDPSFNLESYKIERCQLDEHNSASITNLQKTLDLSPIFRLAAVDPIEDARNIDNDYSAFKAKNCPDYSAKIESCPGKSDKALEKCRQAYLAKSDFNEENQALVENDVHSLTNEDFRDIRKSTDETRHDKTLQNWFNKNVRSRMSSSSVMFKGQGHKYRNEQARDQSYFSDAKVPKEYDYKFNDGSGTDQGKSVISNIPQNVEKQISNGTVSNISNNSNFNSIPQAQVSKVNPGQFIPPFLDNANKKTDNVVPADLDEKEDDKPLSKSALEEIVKDSEEELKQTVDQKKKDDLKDAIAQAKSQIKELEDKADRLVQAPTRSPASNNFPTSNNSVGGGNNTEAAFSSGGGGSSVSRAKLSGTQAGNKSQASRNKALLQANGEITTVDVTSKSKFIFDSKPHESAEKVEVDIYLKPTEELYAEISTNGANLEQYLRSNFSVVPVNKYVSIKCQGTACNPEEIEIFLYVSIDTNNIIHISSVSRGTEVIRVYESEKMEKILEQETKILSRKQKFN